MRLTNEFANVVYGNNESGKGNLCMVDIYIKLAQNVNSV